MHSDALNGGGKAASSLGLVLLLVAGGATDAMSKVYEELGVSALKNHFLLYTFMMAFALCVVVCLVKKQGVTKEDVGFGLVIGIPNFCSALFLLLSLADIPRDDRVSDVQRRGHRHGDACGRDLL